jgi:hypothetical protein
MRNYCSTPEVQCLFKEKDDNMVSNPTELQVAMEILALTLETKICCQLQVP